ncbi:hypothetical protein WA026_004885 [Henosepilachna vigintioctopunctata]|uniref:Uncharacterized protein n=1 Tax=Henosepilachna vigintioctopunctata TaxID=420089 RepID=A0AAW1UN78_9CUCU
MEEELSRAEYASDSSGVSDSDDDDWTPANTARRQILNQKDNSEHDEDSEDTGEGNSAVEDVENSESEDDDNEAETAEPEERAQEPSGSFIAKDKTVWNKTPPTQHQTAAHNVVRQRSGHG